MIEESDHAPASYKGVMVSSTFTDLKEHRAELSRALRKEELVAIDMEDYVPTPDDDVISSSLNMVRKGSAYIGLISHRCGQVPECAERNPENYSITRLEFEEAQKLDRPTLVFIMGADHPVKAGDVETDSEKIKKLKAYRERAKEGRIYVVFESLEDFTRQAIHAVASLRRYLDEQAPPPATTHPQALAPPADAFDVFLSHNTKDKSIICELATALKSRGIRPWLDIDQIPPGALFQDEIEKGMNCSKAAIAAYGEQGAGPWQTEEVRVMLQQSVSSGKCVIPVLLPGAPNRPELPAFLSQRSWLDLSDGLTPERIDKLIWGITGEKPTKRTLPPATDKHTSIPAAPAFYAEPPYIASHGFVVRRAQLELMDDWSAPADAHPVLLFEAIGGAGKSMLTWEWVTKHATGVRDDWAGRFWYSFYERGAVMADFCRRALAYITGRPLDDFKKKKTPELGDMLLHQLQAKPWLIVFDGLERVLVAYHRFDAAQITDEQAGAATDQIAHRDPCAAIRPEDDELLRALAGAAPSKLLLTSRLIPRVLLNASSQPIPGVLRERLPGLRPPEAEALLRSCGVLGDSQGIQDYLQSQCDCHPLVIGVLAGLINDYLPDKGNFDAWAADPIGGGKLNLADLDLVQKRNHILKVALDALDDKGSQLLSTMALLSVAVDYPMLCAIGPYEEAENARQLPKTVRDLENRGLLQYDTGTRRHDLHPVVRGIAAGGLPQEEKERYGQRVVDHFSQQAHSPYEEAETLEDLRNGLNVVRTLLQMGRHEQACYAYAGDLENALLSNLEAHAETLSLLRPFFSQGWATLPAGLGASDGSYLANGAGLALMATGETDEAFAAFGAGLLASLEEESLGGVHVRLTNIIGVLIDANRLAREERCLLLALDLADQLDDRALFTARLCRFEQLARIGQWTDAAATWQLLDPMGRDWPRGDYRPGRAEYCYACFRFWAGELKEDHLAVAEQLAREGKNRPVNRWLHGLRGGWRLEQGRYELAAGSLHEAVRMAREVGQTDADAMQAEAQLALAKFHRNQLPDPRQEAEQLAKARKPFHRGLADLWLAIGDREQAKKHALAAYKWAWADGEPYVWRYELNKSRELLEKLGAEIPDLPPHDPAKDEKFPWEDKVAAAIEKQRAANEAKKAAKKSKED